MTTKLEHALRLARLGFYVFPLQQNGKLPIVAWREKSTRDENTIKAWWWDEIMDWPRDYNIGIDCGKSGLFVFDLDCKEGKAGLETFAALILTYPLPATYTVRTATGGMHYYFTVYGVFYKNTVELLGPGLDTRAWGGFVVAAGSEINGVEYTETDYAFGQIPELPAPWHEQMQHFVQRDFKRLSDKIISADKQENIDWAVNYLENDAPEAIEGSGGNNTTYKVACRIKERGVGCDNALTLMMEHYNPRCYPSWEAEDMERIIHSAYRTAQNATGAKTMEAEFGDLALVIPPSRFKYRGPPRPLSLIPARPYVFGSLVMRKKLTVAVAPPGAGKSTYMLSMAISKASGKPILDIDPLGPGRVLLYNNEDDIDELERRMWAIMQHYKITLEDIGDRLIIQSGTQNPLRIAQRGEGNKIKAKDADELLAAVISEKIDIVIVDPFSETHPALENSNEEILVVSCMYRAVADLGNCGMVLVHHTRKLPGGSSEGHSGVLDSMRGASSLAGVARIVFTFDSMNAKQAKDHGIPENDRGKYALMEVAKANMSAPEENYKWYRKLGEPINCTPDNPDGERVGIIEPIKLTHKREIVADETNELLRDVESQAEGEPRSIGWIARQLTLCAPQHADKKPATLERVIRRMFDDGDTLETKRGTLTFTGNPGKVSFERRIAVSETDKKAFLAL